jgi:hypothetical protein
VIALDIDTQTPEREEIGTELSTILGVTAKARKPQRCSNCNEEGHSARTCPQARGQ